MRVEQFLSFFLTSIERSVGKSKLRCLREQKPMKPVGPNGTACCECGDLAVESDPSSIQGLPNLSSYK